jgi:AcrR family transcriptional regulator
MGAAESRAMYKSAVQSEILKAARELFVHEGYEAFSLRALARRIGYSPAAIYKHFKGKREIFERLAEESFAALAEASAKIGDTGAQDPVDRLTRGMTAYVDFGLKNPDHYRFAFLLQRPAGSRPAKTRGSYESLRNRVLACIDAGSFGSGDCELMAQSLWAAAHGITSLLIQKPTFLWVARRKLINQVIDSAISGLLLQHKDGGRNGDSNRARQH